MPIKDTTEIKANDNRIETNATPETNTDQLKDNKAKHDSIYPFIGGILSSKPTENLFSWNLFSNKENQGFTGFSNANNNDFFTQRDSKNDINKEGKDDDNTAKDKKEDSDNNDARNSNNNHKNNDEMFNSNSQSPNNSDNDGDNNNNAVTLTLTTQQGASGLYEKQISKTIDNLYLFNKEENKFISKGKGFISIETSKQEKKSAVIVFRNQMGSKIVEGYLIKGISKFESYIKNYNNVASITFIVEKEDNKIEIKNIKIPFKFEADFKELEEAFEKTMSYLKNDDDSNSKKE